MPQTGATRHQKFLKSEKSKTKLKTKKKDLPKGTNVTKTNFKVKKIVIKEQLKKHGKTEALSTKKLNIKELLSRLNHFNTKSRTEALEGIKEIITLYSDSVLIQNLGQIILGVTPLVLNIEKVVRHETLKVLHLVLSNTPTEKVEPFFDIMSTYMRSAMTHIDTRIQDDSLLFLDLLLTCSPEKVVQDFHKILPNFLDMISKLRLDSKPGRTLTVNLGSQITTVKWRVKVLHRLKDYLNKYVQYNHVIVDSEPIASKSYIFDETRSNHHPLVDPVYTSVCQLSCFSGKNIQNMSLLEEIEKFKEYISTLLPLLFETWLEVNPKGASNTNIETVINEDAALLLKNSLEVISVVYKLIQYQNKNNLDSYSDHLFNSKFRQQFSKHFINGFPYVTNVRMKQKKLETSPFEDVIVDPKLVLENLEICHLFVKLNPNISVKNQIKEVTAVINYISKIFEASATEPIRNRTMDILDTIFSKENGWTRTIFIMDSLLSKIIMIYNNKDLCKSFKQQIFRFLYNIALNDWLLHFHASEPFQDWMKALPNILLEESITVQTVNILHVFAIRNNESFNKVIKANLLKILANLPKLTISDDSGSQYYFKLFSLLYWIKNWDTESLNLLEEQLMNNEYKSDHGKYIFDTLRLRVGGIL